MWSFFKKYVLGMPVVEDLLIALIAQGRELTKKIDDYVIAPGTLQVLHDYGKKYALDDEEELNEGEEDIYVNCRWESQERLKKLRMFIEYELDSYIANLQQVYLSLFGLDGLNTIKIALMQNFQLRQDFSAKTLVPNEFGILCFGTQEELAPLKKGMEAFISLCEQALLPAKLQRTEPCHGVDAYSSGPF